MPDPLNGRFQGDGAARAVTFVVAHGAWSAGWAWRKIRLPLLAAMGHTLFTPSYTGLGERAHLAAPTNDLETHIQDVLGVLTYEDLRDVVLVGHSYGGMVATGVADRAPERIAQPVTSTLSCRATASHCWTSRRRVAVTAGGGLGRRRRLARAAEPDAAGYLGRRHRLDRRPAAAAIDPVF